MAVVLVAGVFANDARASWRALPPMTVARAYQATAVLGDEWYVGAGTSAPGQYPPSIERFDVKSGQWSIVAQLRSGREILAAAADRSSGRIVFTGGFTPAGPDGYTPFADVELGAAGRWTQASLGEARYGHAIAVVGGRFLISGGWGWRSTIPAILDDAELMDPSGNAWVPAGTMPAGRRTGHKMTTLLDERRVLVTGGCIPDHAMAEVDIFDAASGSWSAMAPLEVPRCRHEAVRLGDGRVLVAGSLNLLEVSATTEIYDPVRGASVAAASMRSPRYDFGAVALPDGRVLVVGGTNDATDGESGALAGTEIYDPVSDRWNDGPTMNEARRVPSVVVLSDGVYVGGGSNAGGPLASAEHLAWADLGIVGAGGSIDHGDGCSCECGAFSSSSSLLLLIVTALLAGRRGPSGSRARLR
jgi:N-acetylneuraminic acid mutarotase